MSKGWIPLVVEQCHYHLCGIIEFAGKIVLLDDSQNHLSNSYELLLGLDCSLFFSLNCWLSVLNVIDGFLPGLLYSCVLKFEAFFFLCSVPSDHCCLPAFIYFDPNHNAITFFGLGSLQGTLSSLLLFLPHVCWIDSLFWVLSLASPCLGF